MLKISAQTYLGIGQITEEIHEIFYRKTLRQTLKPELDDEWPHQDKGTLLAGFTLLRQLCEQIGLKTSASTLAKRPNLSALKKEEFSILIDMISSEMDGKLLFHIPDHRVKYFDVKGMLSAKAQLSFGSVAQELNNAGNCYACGLYTASVFHSMRAAEIGVRVLGADLGVSFPDKPFVLAEWQQILDQVESKIRAISDQTRSLKKTEDQTFYSTAAAQFRYFKDGWLVHVAHARATYEESEALKILDHTRDFFESLSGRLSE